MAGGAAAVRLQSLLDQQNECLQEYGRLLDAQKRSLESDDPARLEVQVEAERALLDRLQALRRASDGLEAAYRRAFPDGEPEAEAARARTAAAAAALAARADTRRRMLCAAREAVQSRLRTLRRVAVRAAAASPDAPRMLDISR